MKRGTASRVFFGVDKTNEDFGGLLLLSQVTLGKKSGMFDEHKGLCIVDNVLLGKGIARVISVIIRGTSPLSLPDAIADSLSYVKAFGGTEQGLPSGYTQLEYIESSGTQYIDIDVSGDATFIGTAQSTTDSPTTSQVLVANSGASAGHWFGVQSPGAGSSFAKRWGLGATATASSTIDGTTKVDFEITFTQSSQYGTVNDQVLNRESSTSAHTNWVVFAGNTTPLYGFIGKVWGLKVVQNDVLVRNLIPAKNSSNVIGMYDIVNDVFYENAGTGTFAAGPTAVPTPDTPMDIVSNNGALKARHQSGLPLGYTLLDFVESNGTQYIDTGVKGTNDTVLETEVAFSNTSAQMLWAYNSNAGGNTDRITVYLSNGGRCNFGDTSTDSHLPNYITVGTFATIKQDNTGIYVNGTKRVNYNATNTFTSLGNMYFLWANGTGAAPTSGKVKWFKITRGGNVVMNLVPAKNSSGVIGMYDLVSGQFFTNAGTGDFVAGTPVSDPVEIYTDGTVETIGVYGGNLVDLSAVTDGYYYDPQGNYTALSAARLTDYIPIEAGKDVKIYFKSLFSVSNLNVRINIFNSSKVWQSQEVLSLDPLADGTKTITPADNGYIRVSGNYSGGAIVDWNTASITESFGSATAEMLLKVGDYQDVQSILDGVVTRKVGVKVLDGTEEIWGTVSQTPDAVTILTNCYTVAVPLGDAPIDKRRVYCTHLISSDTLPAADARQGYALLGNGGTGTPAPLTNKYAIGLGLTTRFPTIAGLKQWLAEQYAAGTPVIVVYPLATETTESVAGQTLQVQAGDNTLEITQASMSGLELEAQYQAAVSLTIQEVQDANLDPNVEVTIN